jgi:hypothetical protein
LKDLVATLQLDISPATFSNNSITQINTKPEQAIPVNQLVHPFINVSQLPNVQTMKEKQSPTKAAKEPINHDDIQVTAASEERFQEIASGQSIPKVKTTRTVTYRPAQSNFRSTVLAHYRQCVITGCDIPQACQAAHILDNTQDDASWENGLLLRSDIHDLFDSSLLRLRPSDDPNSADVQVMLLEPSEHYKGLPRTIQIADPTTRQLLRLRDDQRFLN